jgi:xylulose-5-phosphate/fructose-6-phosphate phosphoketolase
VYHERVLTRTPKEWLNGYKPRELFDQGGRPPSGIDTILLPKEEKRMGRRKETYDAYKPLDLPDWKQFGQQKGTDVSETMVIGQYLADVFKRYLWPSRNYS